VKTRKRIIHTSQLACPMVKTFYTLLASLLAYRTNLVALAT